MLTIDLHRIARELYAPLLTTAMRLTRDLEAARDLVQDTFERCLTRLPPGIQEKEVMAWLLVVMRHLFIDELRTLRATGRRLVFDEVDEYPLAPPPDPEDAPTWQRVCPEDAELAVRTLPEHLREPYEMHVYRKLPYRDIARILRLPAPTVGTRIHRARRHLRRTLLNDLHHPQRLSA
jgi:RNA polymerase sigma-70 factor, ECF subfamily